MTSRPVLLVIAHGSRDPRHAATVHALVRRVRARRPGLRVETGFLDFNIPSVPGCWSPWRRRAYVMWSPSSPAHPRLPREGGHPGGPAGGPGAPAHPSGGGARPLPLLTAALERRLYEAGLTPPTSPRRGRAGLRGVHRPGGDRGDRRNRAGVAAHRLVRRAARVRLRIPSAHRGRGARTARPRLRACRRRPYVLAPGFLPDRIARGAAEADVLADVLGPAPEVARVLLERYDEARVPVPAALGA